MSRKEKRKELKKLKRKQLRREAALLSAEEDGEEGEGDDEALARERAEHDEQERLWMLREEEARKEWLRKQAEDAERKVRIPILPFSCPSRLGAARSRLESTLNSIQGRRFFWRAGFLGAEGTRLRACL